jgi:predicted CopG family antitoxin
MTKYTIKVSDDLWEKFKRTVTKDKTLNQVIVELIRKRVEKWSTSEQ